MKRLRNQGKKGHEMGSPSKSNGRKQIILDNFEAQLLRRIVLSFYYSAKKEAPILDKIKVQLPLADGFPKMYERMDIVAARHRFLLDVQKFRTKGTKSIARTRLGAMPTTPVSSAGNILAIPKIVYFPQFSGMAGLLSLLARAKAL